MLSPCPYCSGHPVALRVEGNWSAFCSAHGAVGPRVRRRADLHEMWRRFVAAELTIMRRAS